MIRVKICGITNLEDALCATQCGAWALGFVFYKKSPRYVSPSKAKKIVEALPPFVTPVGVFVNHNEKAVRDIAEFCQIKTLQFHGDETPDYCRHFSEYKIIKAFHVKEGFNISDLGMYRVAAYLFDTYQEDVFGGSGKTFNWDIIKDRKFPGPIILSGGLDHKNVSFAIAEIKPFAVDVSSGVEESPGKKDEKLLKMLFENISSSL